MPDADTRRTFDTAVIPAALVFPGDPLPNMGPDAARIPVRVVWREADAPTDRTAGGGSSAAIPLPDPYAMPGADHGGDKPPPVVPAESGPERPPVPGLRGVDPIATFLQASEALDRITGGGNTGMPGATTPATREKDDQKNH